MCLFESLARRRTVLYYGGAYLTELMNDSHAQAIRPRPACVLLAFINVR